MKIDHKHKFASIILAAGKGERMRSDLPKVMHRLANMPMIAHVLGSLKPLSPQKTIVVIAPHMDTVKAAAQAAFPESVIAIQDKQQGTGHAVRCVETALKGFNGPVLILFGDTPLITPQTLLRVLDACKSSDVVVVGMRLPNPTGYGRLVVGKKKLKAIVEEKDASAKEKRIDLCNSGVMAVSGKHLFSLLAKLKPDNAVKEYYLTDIVAAANKHKLRCSVIEADAGELSGINDRGQLSEGERMVQHRLRVQAMKNGATLIAPHSVYFSMDTRIGHDVIIQPHVIFGPGVTIADNVEIRSFSHIEGARIEKNAIIGPFARLRPGSVIEEGAHVGNFVELKKTRLGKGAKANHLSYVGDSDVGANANIGAGTITCNYDGISKYETTIGAGAFIGSNTSLVAPVTIGAGAIIGAGSVITENVEADALAVTRPPQVNKPGKAKELKSRKKKAS